MAKQNGVTLPDMNGNLITTDGQIRLSMDTSYGRHGHYPAQDSVHLYLAGVVQLESDKNVADQLENTEVMKAASMLAHRKIVSYAAYKFYGTKEEKAELRVHKGRQNDVTELVGMAYHMAFDCENHFKRLGKQLVLKAYKPQTQARHTVDSQKLLTTRDLASVLEGVRQTKVEIYHMYVVDAVLVNARLNIEDQ